MKRRLLAIILTLATIGTSVAQEKKGTGNKKAQQKAQTSNLPAAFQSNKHLYFPDYYAFYDPQRGYIFWNEEEKEWNSSQQIPKFMSEVDMSKTRIQILEGLSLDLRPEQNYPNYMKLYPATQNNPKVPVPNSTR